MLIVCFFGGSYFLLSFCRVVLFVPLVGARFRRSPYIVGVLVVDAVLLHSAQEGRPIWRVPFLRLGYFAGQTRALVYFHNLFPFLHGDLPRTDCAAHNPDLTCLRIRVRVHVCAWGGGCR